MKFSENWLREWVNPDIDTGTLAAQLTMAGLEVDGIEPAAGPFSGVIVAEVVATAQHPDADKLSLCQVNTGEETCQVVCGAPNVAAGQKVPFARVGAVLGDDFRIRKATLRGVESQGMICSAEELGLEEKSAGILELPADAPLGEDIRRYLNLDDALVEVDLTPNRGDCLCIAGLAREVGVINQVPVQQPAIEPVPAGIDDSFPVTLESLAHCPRYLGRIVRNIDPKAKTPLWMTEKLRRSGIRSIDPVVDITNFVLMELGQPMHAFDFDKLVGGIHVRLAGAGEKLTLLDGREVELTPDTLVIADTEKALAMAGVMGGEDSGVSAYTRHIFLESAFFTPTTIAGKARAYGLQTDAAHRFERGVDYDLARTAMERATGLMLAITGGQAGPVIEAVEALPGGRSVTLRAERVERILGIRLDSEQIIAILTGLGLEMTADDGASWTFNVPSWRFDIAIEEDLIEELARIYGYNNLPVTEATGRFHLKPHPEVKTAVRDIRQRLVSLGYQEVITYSFVDSKLEALLGSREGDALALANPISQDMDVMRRSLWPGLLGTLQRNQNRQQTRLRIFEHGLVFYNKNNKLEQSSKVSSMIWGSRLPEQWGAPTTSVDFFDIKGDAESLLALACPLDEIAFTAAEHPALQPGQSARITRGNETVGWLGALSPEIQQHLDIPGKVYLLEVDLAGLGDAVLPVFTQLSRFPSVRRDLAMVVDANQETAAILAAIRAEAGNLLTDSLIFDQYRGQNIEKTKKSLALGLTFQHPSRTLTDQEINAIIDKCIKVLEAQFNAELRI